ncbi:Acetyltransferase (GNAT) family protein [Bacillus sp. THAF10]|uniref:GNAT family N-acetyltransferase n=1 Tax=Bacillus sp. THAF10 TaxID=2587848 RepID=UPI001267B659|nr:GNAT family N-acetyltransferase [Bacillus sp. THAF10]QFT89596.1 Acetyltransferase (GNAT) family protein [Bacillus sp. THAF10]
MQIRLAKTKDISQLIKMRWDFTIEHDESKRSASFADFEKECQAFLEKAIIGKQWFIWVVEADEKIVSHIYIELIQKVPRPGRITYPFAYMTNVYTIPDYRNKGLGSQLLERIHQWVKENNYEFVIVWPSEESINYYVKNGYIRCSEPMEYYPS